MYNYTASTLAIRAKCSLSFHYLSLPEDKPFCCHNPYCHFFINPNILSRFLLGFSFPLASKSLFHGGRRRFGILYRRLDPEDEFSGLEELYWKKGRRENRNESIEWSSRKEGKRGIGSWRSDGFGSDCDSRVSGVGRRRAGGESLVGFSNRKKGARHDEDNVAEEEVREFHKYVDDSWRYSSKRDESTKRNGSFRGLKVKEVDEKVDRRASLARKVSISESGSDRRSKNVRRTSVSGNVRKMESGENSVSTARQNNEIDDRRRILQKQSKIADLHYNNAEIAALSQRVCLDRGALEQDESRRRTRRLNEISLFDGGDFNSPNSVKDSSQLSRNNRSQMETELRLSLENRSEGGKGKLTMAGNSIQLRGGERKQIVRGAVELDDAQRDTQKLSEVSEVLSGKNEAYSLSRENMGIEFKSCSVRSSVPATKDKGTQVEMHDAYYDQIELSRLNANNVVDSTNSWVPAVCGVDSQEYGAILASNQVSSVSEQNDQVSKQAYLLYGAKMESETSEFDLITSNNTRISSLQDTYNSRIENEKQLSLAETSSLALIREQKIQRSYFTGESSQSESMDMTSTGSLHGFSSPQPTFNDKNYETGLIGYQKIQHGTNYSATKFNKPSALHASELVSKLQKEVVALNESGKIPNVFDGVQIGKQGRRDVQATLRIENRNEISSTVSTQERKERQSSLLAGESSKYKTMNVASTGSLDVFGRANTYSEMGDHIHSDEIRHITNDAIESTKRLDESSAFHVDEFFDEVRQEILNESGKDSNISTGFQIEETNKREGLSSSGLEMRAPSEEMWGQIESSQKTSNAEEPEENSAASEAVDLSNPMETATHRSPKSLWSYVADIIRMSWILRDHSNSKTSKSVKRTSSNESLSSEAWFSGPELEQDGAGDEAHNTKKTSLIMEAGLVKESVQLPLQESKKGDVLTVIDPTSSIFSGFMASGIYDRTASPSEEVEHTQDLTSTLATPGVAIVEQELATKSDAALSSITDAVESRVRNRVRVLKPSSSYPAAVMRVGFSSSLAQSAGAVQMEVAQVEKDDNNSSLEQFEQPLASTVDSGLPRFTDLEEVDKLGSIIELDLDPFSEKLPVVGGTKEGGIKQRKFQRSKQVLSEQFDEWEDAFKRENEVKKLDEFFMREAIMEAKKSADAWEVPVGAVLVQNGRIIARGCNMVEELRDSTAHAEMICIREASNVLRDWRLAETTLYVTLEPCPMCAGAILQARIDTVVWGAPNRLLGADGSWVRLFPGGDGGSDTMNPPSQMVGPVHPFHPKITIRRGILELECGEVMQQFFKLRRKKDKKPEFSPPSCLPMSNRPTKFFSKLHNIFGMMFCL